MKILILLVVASLLLSACAVYVPGGGVVVDPYEHDGRGGFCPPGQAKKGNC